VWHVKLASSLPPIGWDGRAPLSGLAAGDGILVVPAGNMCGLQFVDKFVEGTR
jgi:hypothetical protein